MSMTDEQFDALLAEARKRGANYPHLEINFENRLQCRIREEEQPRGILTALARPALAAALACMVAIGTFAAIGLLNAPSPHEADFYTLLDDYMELILAENGDFITSADIWSGEHFELPFDSDLR